MHRVKEKQVERNSRRKSADKGRYRDEETRGKEDEQTRREGATEQE